MAENINGKWPFPVNVGTFGVSAEEMKALQKRLEKNPDAAPMPEVAPIKLLTATQAADDVRLGEPRSQSERNDAAPVPLTHVVVRRVLVRSRSKPVVDFDDAVETEDLGDLPASRREQMRAMLARERSMLDLLGVYNELAEFVRYRLPGESKV